MKITSLKLLGHGSYELGGRIEAIFENQPQGPGDTRFWEVFYVDGSFVRVVPGRCSVLVKYEAEGE